MSARQTNLRQLVIAVDPDWVRDSRIVEEYRFSGPGGAKVSTRRFMSDYTKRGAYHDPAPEEEA